MKCQNCGVDNLPNSKFCRSCGSLMTTAPPSITSAPAPVARPPTSQGFSQLQTNENARIATGIFHDLKTLNWKQHRVLLISAIMLIAYILLARNIIPLIIGFAISFLIRKYSNQIDEHVKPIWPYRNLIPSRLRRILGWVAPVVVALIITNSPFFLGIFGWLPFIGSDSSVFVFTTLIAAILAYILMREPRPGLV